jgi:hypothetical protein
MKITLDVLSGPHQGASFEFDQHATFLVGRGPAAHLRLADDRYFSRHHFLLELNPPRCFLRDLSSTNGTMVNRRRIREAHLAHGDIIEGGNTRIRLTVLDERPAVQSVPAPTARTATEGLTRSLAGPASTPAPRMSATNDVKSADTRAELTPRVHGYECLRKLGQGGMGAVYHVQQQATGRLYALKVIVPESAASEKAMARFLREISVLSRLDHPRIVRFHEMGLAQGQFYFAMEYVETFDYIAMLTTRPAASQVRAACKLVCQLLSGVIHAHERGFIHRDIKPSNLLVGRNGAKLEAKLADFGLAKNFENAGFSGMTRDGQTLGTLAYMAPEQVADARRATPSVDIYSAGATLYSLLAGRPPHGSLHSNELILAILEKLPERVDRINPAVPRGLALVIERALAIDPADRYPSAQELRDALLPFARSVS